MEKRSFISAYQVVMLLFVTRLLLSTSYQAILEAGNSLQDLLISAVIGFFINFVVAVPILFLLKRHPSKGLIECGVDAMGRANGNIIAVLYFFFFIFNAAIYLGNFENYFTAAVIPDIKSYLFGIILLIVCFYGAAKGIESIARFGAVVAVFYLVTFILTFFMVLPRVDIGLLKPLLYHGPWLMIRGVFMNYNLNVQIVAFALLASFLKPGKSLSKTFAVFNVLSFAAYFVVEFVIVTVTGAYGAKDLYPVHLLASIAQFSVFERLDAFEMIAWILNLIITVTLYLYLAVTSLEKAGFNKRRRLKILVSGVLIFLTSLGIFSRFNFVKQMMVSGYYCLVNTVFIVVIPLAVCIADTVKRKARQNAGS